METACPMDSAALVQPANTAPAGGVLFRRRKDVSVDAEVNSKVAPPVRWVAPGLTWLLLQLAER